MPGSKNQAKKYNRWNKNKTPTTDKKKHLQSKQTSLIKEPNKITGIHTRINTQLIKDLGIHISIVKYKNKNRRKKLKIRESTEKK